MKSAMHRWAGALALLLVSAGMAQGQDRDQARAWAKSSAERLRTAGEPMDRCAFGVIIEGRVVTDLLYPGPLSVGDRVQSFNGTDVSSSSDEEIIAQARKLTPGTRIAISVDRGGIPLQVDVNCTNSRTFMEPMLTALDLAARGKFDDCFKVLDGTGQQDSSTLLVKAQCAANSRKFKASLGELAYVLATKAVRLAHVVAARREAVIEQLRASEAEITQVRGTGAFRALVEETRRWPGGEALWDRSEPDWAAFRTQAEAALRQRLIDPESARIEWPNGFVLGYWRPMFAAKIEGYWTCGRINARNRMGGYTGATSFVVVLGRDGGVRYSEIGTAEDVDFLTAQCQNSARLLPPPNVALTGNSTASAVTVSVADEIQKLVALKESGAITQAEFDAAKAKLLGLSR